MELKHTGVECNNGQHYFMDGELTRLRDENRALRKELDALFDRANHAFKVERQLMGLTALVNLSMEALNGE